MNHPIRTTLLTLLTATCLTGETIAQGGSNPLTRNRTRQGPSQEAPDAFARRFHGDGIELVLKRAASGYEGTLRFGDSKYPVKARALGPTLKGSFHASGEDYEFSATLAGDRMTLTSDGRDFAMTGDPLPKPALARATAETAGVSVRVPTGWSIVHQHEDGFAILAPDLGQPLRDSAVLSVHQLQVFAEEREGSLQDMMLNKLDSVFPTMTLGDGLSISLEASDGSAFRVGSADCVQFPMTVESGGRKGRGWVAMRVDADRALICWAVGLGEHAEAALKVGKQVFAGLERAKGGQSKKRENPLKRRERTERKEQGGDNPLKRRKQAEPRPHNQGSADDTILLTRHTVVDQGFGGIESHRFLAPRGWRADAKVLWTQHPSQYLHFVADISDRDGTAVTFGPSTACAYGDSTSLQTHGAFDGQSFADGTAYAEPPQNVGDTALHLLLPRMRPQAVDVRLVRATLDEQAEQDLRQLFASVIATVEQSGHLQSWLHCESALLEYQENGQRFEEELRYVVVGTHTQGLELVSGPWGKWVASDVRSVRAPKGQLESRRPLLETILASVQETPRWAISKHEMKMQEIQRKGAQGRATIAAMHQRGQMIAQNNSQLSDMQMQGWRDRNRSQDRMHAATIRGIRDVQAFSSRSGTTFEVDQRFDRVFENGRGEVLLSTNPGFDPANDPRLNSADWTRLVQSR